MSHVHKWGAAPKQQRKFGERVYICKDPDCYAKFKAEMLIGKRSICFACGKEFILTRENLLTAQPKCLNCAETAAARKFREETLKLADELKEMFDETKICFPIRDETKDADNGNDVGASTESDESVA